MNATSNAAAFPSVTRPRIVKTGLFSTALLLTLAACGGGDDDPAPAVAATPQLTLTITERADLPGSYGTVGAYERLTGSWPARSIRRTRTTRSSRISRSRRSTAAAWSSTAPSSCCSSRRT